MRNIETKEDNRNLNSLPSGKEFGIYKVVNSSLYCIKFTSGGPTPPELDGKFTDAVRAQKAIKAYLDKLEQEAAVKAQKALDQLTTEAQADDAHDVKEPEILPEEPAIKKSTAKKATK